MWSFDVWLLKSLWQDMLRFDVWLPSRFISVTEFAKKLENKKHHKEKEEWTYQNHVQIQNKRAIVLPKIPVVMKESMYTT